MSTTIDTLLTPQQVAQYEADGYLIVPDLLTQREIQAFVDYEKQPKPPELNKGLLNHTVDPQWQYLATHPRIAGIANQLLGGRPMTVQTMFLNKAPSGGKGIALHQDTHYLPSEPNTLMACWIALTDTDPGNGGFGVVPGSHKKGLQSAKKNLNDEQVSWEMEHDMRDRDGREYKQKMFSFEIEGLDMSTLARLTVPRGAVFFFTGMTIHGSFANKSTDRLRSAFAVHYVREGTWMKRCDVQNVTAAM